jgi:hypothetical protein
VAPASRLQSFETDLLIHEENLTGLAALNRELLAKTETIDSPQRVVLDMSSTEIPVCGQQENSTYKGRFESTCTTRYGCSTAGATVRRHIRAAAFAKPEIHEALEGRGVKQAIRAPASDGLERDIAELLTRQLGRPSHKPVVWYRSFLYQAASWKTARRVVMRFHNKRGTAEHWIIEGMQAIKMTRLSCQRFRFN